jgi:hypothetical protein
MLSMSCPTCRSSFHYVPEQAGSTVNCVRCFNEMTLKSQPWHGVGGAALSVAFMGVLVVFGTLGAVLTLGVYGLFGGGLVFGAAVLAIMAGMPIRTVLGIFDLAFVGMVALVDVVVGMNYLQAMQVIQ